MSLRNFIPQSVDVNTLPPEELSAAVLRDLNVSAERDRTLDPPIFQLHTYCLTESNAYHQRGQPACSHAISAAWGHLVSTGMLAFAPEQGNHGWYFLTPRARAIKSDLDYQHFRHVSLYPQTTIHAVIKEETYAEFLRGDYETAVFKAFKAVEVAVRPLTSAPPHVVGRDLMVKAFHAETGSLRDAMEPTAERESLMELFRGAVGRFKNPTSHREVNFGEPAEVIEILQLASLLMRIVDRRIATLRENMGV
jgi:uncharacterized protein (TIGR02391 family)